MSSVASSTPLFFVANGIPSSSIAGGVYVDNALSSPIADDASTGDAPLSIATSDIIVGSASTSSITSDGFADIAPLSSIACDLWSLVADGGSLSTVFSSGLLSSISPACSLALPLSITLSYIYCSFLLFSSTPLAHFATPFIRKRFFDKVFIT